MPSTGAGKRTHRAPKRGGKPIQRARRVSDPSLARTRAAALAQAIEHLEDDMFFSSTEGYDEPGLDGVPDEDAFDLGLFDEDGPFKDEDEPD